MSDWSTQNIVNENNSSTSISAKQKETTPQTFQQEQFSKIESSYSHSETVTSSYTKDFGIQKALVGKAPSNLDNAKTSFLQSQINQTATANEIRNGKTCNNSRHMSNEIRNGKTCNNS